MQRYLLFDSSCGVCSRLAKRIESEATGKLVARSLHDPEIVKMLNTAKADWRWEPTLLEMSESGQIIVTVGCRMHIRLVKILGLQRAFSIARLLSKNGVSILPHLPQRRSFLQRVLGFIFTSAIFLREKPVRADLQLRQHRQVAHPLTRIPVVSTETLDGEDMAVTIAHAHQSVDIQNIYSVIRDQGIYVPELQMTRETRSILASQFDNVIAVKHLLEDGNELSVAGWTLGDNIFLLYTTKNPIGNYQSQAMRLILDPETNALNMMETSVNGRLRTLTPVDTINPEQCPCQYCIAWNWTCLTQNGLWCAACIAACASSGSVACALCVAASCPWLLNCCEQWGC